MLADPVTALGLLCCVALGGLAGALALAWQPRRALYLLVAAVILLEQYPMAFPTTTAAPWLYNNLNTTLGIGALKLNPLELILLTCAFGAGLRVLCGRVRMRARLPLLLALAYGGWMAFSVVWGVANHGNWKVALWILRPVFYFILTALLTEALIETPRQARNLVLVLLLATTIKAGQIALRRALLHGHGEEYEAYGAHECTSFQLWSAWLILCGWFTRGGKLEGRALLALLPVLGMGILANDRRINIATGGLGVMALMVLQRPDDLRRRSRPLLALAAMGLLYIVVGWFGPKNPITAPVKGFKQGIRAELMGENTDSSSHYRKVERYNLKHTVRAHPILGTGLGVRYLQLIPLDDLGFEYAVYISHNQVLLVHSATGSVGYWLFLSCFVGLVASMTMQWRRLEAPWQRAVALAGMLSVMNWLIVGYYDMQLFFFRNSMIMGVFIGLPAALERIQDEARSLQGATR